MSAIEDARRVIEARLAELEKEREQLRGALESLSPGNTRPTKPRTSRRSSRSRGSHRSGGKRAARALFAFAIDPRLSGLASAAG